MNNRAEQSNLSTARRQQREVDAEVIHDAHVADYGKIFFFKKCESVDQKDTDHKHAISNLESEWVFIHFNIL